LKAKLKFVPMMDKFTKKTYSKIEWQWMFKIIVIEKAQSFNKKIGLKKKIQNFEKKVINV
jgi:hypothetical protein